MNDPLLQVEALTVSFRKGSGWHDAVRDVSFSLPAGRIMGLVGESGCGKSLTARAIMGLLGRSPRQRVSGRITFDGRDLTSLTERELQSLRGDQLALIPQDPMTSLNPAFTVGNQIAEVPRIHRGASRKDAAALAVSMMQQVGITDPSLRAKHYPHQFSGGMRQRGVIAMGLAGKPSLLIADEPTTALDVTIQAQVLDLLLEIRNNTGCAILLITHDLGVVAEFCDTVSVMYAGRIVETGTVERLFSAPAHPYTRGLLNSLPSMDKKQRLQPIPGQPPDLENLPAAGCPFRDRCPVASTPCAETMPELKGTVDHQLACWHGDIAS